MISVLGVRTNYGVLGSETGVGCQSLVKKLHTRTLTPGQNSLIASRWNYPSDHLPVYANLLGIMKMCTFNTLNSKFISHYKNPVWTSGYFVVQDQKPSLKYQGLTLREEEVYENILQMIKKSSNSLEVICLQECSDKMCKFLTEQFANEQSHLNMQVLTTDGGLDNHVLTLVKTSHNLRVTSAFSKALWNRSYHPGGDRSREEFGLDQWRPAQGVVLEKITPFGRACRFTVINVHISSAGKSKDYKISRVNELCRGANLMFHGDDALVIAGDYNISRSCLRESEFRDNHDILDTPYSNIDAVNGLIEPIDLISVRSRPLLRDYSSVIPVEECFDDRASDAYKVFAEVLADCDG
jgi:exonuclease III